MKRALFLLLLGLLPAGCAEDEDARRPTPPQRAVVVSNREPGSCCRALGSVEAQSDHDEAATGDTLREYAAARGANYVVLEGFVVFDERVIARARIFDCPELAALAP
ncbi:MAG TPA: hypothetical protein VGL86_00095 [Polyangia bacterium]|jgi:hypothetical protein